MRIWMMLMMSNDDVDDINDVNDVNEKGNEVVVKHNVSGQDRVMGEYKVMLGKHEVMDVKVLG